MKAALPLAITMGEPAGVGPELVVRLWKDRKPLALPAFVFIGCKSALLAHDSDLPVTEIEDAAEATAVFDKAIPVLKAGPALKNVTPGVIDPASAPIVIAAIDKAVELASEGKVAGVVTCPIQKSALYAAGFTAPGHTEYLAERLDLPASDAVMMLATEGLRVIPVTIHMALKDVPAKLTSAAIVHAGLTAAHDLKARFGIDAPRIAIAALNPHAGEGGALGIEEGTHIQPAIWALEDAGIAVSGPHAADTMFHADARAAYDVALCMYHDQALVPLKTLDFYGGVNITLGLPIIRTSPDHGTALSLAGTGKARTDSMLAAIREAAAMAAREAVNG
ncbi:4-hydroxythreonine-4-phosphate dehydrogenase PdxA [Pseudokordiimonas caeni]|uniref:4-hydroxythreonine-4-phosphate dehydrogenase PdxA n=1 Tax=Pseudokordiimonas caeni TaxID=2997908 RepID=UPI002810E933|nr:4-hydroxythreonine-4-phosphate dehydrogenase PdxA [Pseudokordiimonas caeni]